MLTAKPNKSGNRSQEAQRGGLALFGTSVFIDNPRTHLITRAPPPPPKKTPLSLTDPCKCNYTVLAFTNLFIFLDLEL